jgi:hypothetical protein
MRNRPRPQRNSRLLIQNRKLSRNHSHKTEHELFLLREDPAIV